MNIRHWRHFLAIAETGSFSLASQRCGVAQPVLSREMRDLEDGLGVRLFVRHSRGTSLSEAGALFRRRVETMLQQIEALPAEIRASAEEPSGTLSVGFPPSLAGVLTGPAVAAFHERYPAVRLSLREGTSIQLRDALVQRDVDIAVLTIPLADPRLVLEPLYTEAMVLVSRPDSSVVGGEKVTLRDIASLPLILSTRPNSTRIIIEHALEELGVSLNIAVETDVAPIVELIRHGVGHAILPASFFRGRLIEGVVLSPLEDLKICWAIGVLRSRELSVGAQRMYAIVNGIARPTTTAERITDAERFPS
ncbi:LysR family transcriptional regulator [Rhizobium rhizogenes]|uniref:LysR family transcriptional regulator n=1 Tax=Rhizobium rhizogenes TaxID=359 RepID=UPI001573781E|nr:LysR family transcriptional regulator [Rhizobium rhizogenes]NTI78463.1 LysR family transcriptional regulator [Rhizobium rhizogenes]